MEIEVGSVAGGIRPGRMRQTLQSIFTKKEIRVASKQFSSFDGVMIGYSHNGHAQFLTTSVHFQGVGVGFAADTAEPRGTHPGVGGMDVKVASHDAIVVLRYKQHVKEPANST